MRSSIVIVGTRLALMSAAVLIGAAAPVLANEGATPSFAHVEGVVVDATDQSLKVRPAVGDPVSLTVGERTLVHFPPEIGRPAPVIQAVKPRAGGDGGAPAPSLSRFHGFYARAAYDAASSQAIEVWLSVPQPLRAAGLVGELSNTGFSLFGENGHVLPLVLSAETRFYLDGQPATLARLARGDRAEVLFLLHKEGNIALVVKAQSPAPRTFEGTVSALPAVQNAARQFSASRGDVTLRFTINNETAIRLDGQPAGLADLAPGFPVVVLYQERGGVHLALRVSARRLKNTEPKADVNKQREDELNKRKEEALKQRQEAELKKKQDLELKQQREAELNKKREAAAKQKHEAELKRKQELELKQRREEEQKKQREEARKKKEEEAKKKREAELKKKQEAELKRKQELELTKQREAELKAKREEEARKKREAELKKKQEAELKRKQALELKQQQAAELKRKREEENRKRKEEALKKQQELELKKKLEAEVKNKREAEAKKREMEPKKNRREELKSKKNQTSTGDKPKQ